MPNTRLHQLRESFVRRLYANHNQSRSIQQALESVLSAMTQGQIGLNVGAGNTRLHPAILNLDIAPGIVIDCLADAMHLPFGKSSFDVIVTQETLEHVENPETALREMHRVLRPGGLLYCQLPFTIGYHPGPTDFWRFSRQGIQELIERCGFRCEKIEIAVGPATGFYRIAVEFFAVTAARLVPALYLPAKGVAALMLYPTKWLDGFLIGSVQADRIAGGYYVIGRK